MSIYDDSSQSLGENVKGKERDDGELRNGGSSSRSTGIYRSQYDTDSMYERPTRQGTSFSVPQRKKNDELRDEEKPWDPKNILTFDGGGVRGYYSLLILQSLMRQVKHMEENFIDGDENPVPVYSSFAPEREPRNVSHVHSDSLDTGEFEEPRPEGSHFLPCHYFEYICGTSTGALIAIMLSRLRMTVGDCLAEYENLGTAVFGKPRLFHQIRFPITGFHRTKFDTKALEDAIIDVTSRRGEVHDHGTDKFKTESGLCKVFVLAYRKPRNKREEVTMEVPYIFRSYDHIRRPDRISDAESSSSFFPRNGGIACMHNTWEVARAATAAPAYFDPMEIWHGGHPPKTKKSNSKYESEVFSDGGIGDANNPSFEALKEIHKHGGVIGTFVSIGTGRQTQTRTQQGSLEIIRGGFDALTNPEGPHLRMKASAEEFRLSYHRFNQPGALDVAFDEWNPKANGKETLATIRNGFNTMINMPAAQERLKSCAEELVRRRRLRTRESSKWERFSLGAYFVCPFDGCFLKKETRNDRSKFDSHLLNEHGKKDERERNGIIQGSRRFWRYQPPRLNSNGNEHI